MKRKLFVSSLVLMFLLNQTIPALAMQDEENNAGKVTRPLSTAEKIAFYKEEIVACDKEESKLDSKQKVFYQASAASTNYLYYMPSSTNEDFKRANQIADDFHEYMKNYNKQKQELIERKNGFLDKIISL